MGKFSNSITIADPPPLYLPPPAEVEPLRHIGMAAKAGALALALLWPPVLGVFLSLAIGLWKGNAFGYAGAGLALGIAGGVLLSLATLVWFVLLQHMDKPTPAAAAEPTTTTVTYSPLSAHQDTRLIQLRVYDKTIDQVNVRDITWFVSGLRERGHSMRAWLGAKSPSGQIVDAEYWRALCKPLRKAGVIVGAASRRSGRLTTTDVDVILTQLGLDPYDSDLWRRDPDQ